MEFEIFGTTAEYTIAGINAVTLTDRCVGPEYVSVFMKVDDITAEKALGMATQLGFLKKKGDEYTVCSPLCNYLVTTEPYTKALILRLLLEEYKPFRILKARIAHGVPARQAAHEVKTIFSISASIDEIWDTLISLGTYTNSIKTLGGGNYEIEEPAPGSFTLINEAIENHEMAKTFLIKTMGVKVFGFLDQNNVIEPLISALLALPNIEADPVSPVNYAGKATESFLSQIGTFWRVNLTKATGINAIVDELRKGGKITAKHKNMFKYLGHIRNAADHGPDKEINNNTWKISTRTATEFVFVAISSIKSLVNASNGIFEL